MIAALPTVVLRALAPLDAVRARVLRAAFPLARPALGERSRRSAWYGALSVLVAFGCALTAPLSLLTLGPLVLGVPHLVSDVRYLVVRQKLAARAELRIFVLPWLLLAIASPELRWGLFAVASAALCARAPLAPRVLVALTCATAGIFAQRSGGRAELWFAHAHNLIALGVWALWARKPARELMPMLLLFALAAALIASGVLEPWLTRSGALSPSRFALDANGWVTRFSLASPALHPTWALRCVLFFAFAQSLHYAIWLRLIPEADRKQSGLRSFAGSYRALTRDLGTPVLAVSAALLVGVWCLAARDVHAAYDGYVRLATFHGPLELGMLALLALERRPLSRAG